MVENPKRKFKGIWIPRIIWLSKELSTQEKVFLAEIDSLEDEKDGCFASNKYFAEFFGLTKKRVSIIITSLCARGYIASNIDKKKGNKRSLRICRDKWPQTIPGNADTPIPQKGDSPYPRKQGQGHLGNADTPILENKDQDNIDNSRDKKEGNHQKNFSKELSKQDAYLLLRQYGINVKTADVIVFRQNTPPTAIAETIQNGLAREKFEKDFTLKPGYIIASLNGARREGKIVKPTKHSKRLQKILQDKKTPHKPLDPAEFTARKEKQIKSLTK